MVKRIFGNDLNKNDLPWTDFNMSPREIYLEACSLIAEKFRDYGFKYSKSTHHIVRKSSDGKLIYKLGFSSSAGNQKGESVILDIYFQVLSTGLKNFRKQLNKKHLITNSGQPDDLVTTVNFGYLTDRNCFEDGHWNLITTSPNFILSQLEKFALPGFNKFENLDILISTLRKQGQTPELYMDFRTLDFVMFYGGFEAASDVLKQMLLNRKWSVDYRNLYSNLEKGLPLDDKRHLLISLVERGFIYGIKIND